VARPTKDYTRSGQRVARLCATAADARELRLTVLSELRQVIAFDAYAWLLTDPQTWVGSAPLADVPCLPELPALIRLKYQTTINRWTGLPAGQARALHQATGGDLARSRLWRELLHGYGVHDMLSVAFTDRFGCWGFLDLWRSASTPGFSAAEAAFLGQLIKPLTAALRRTQAEAFTPGQPVTGPVVLLLTPDLRVRAQTGETQDYLRRLVPPDDDQAPVPAGAYNVAAQLLAAEQGVDDHPPWARVHLTGGAWLTLRAARIGEADVPDGPAGAAGVAADPAGRDVAVTIEATTPADRAGLFARANGLTRRESELLRQLIAGGDTRDVAQQMFLSTHTVQDHLKSVFAKTGTRSRQALLSRVVGA
jgi:DNA-binding CsgD family transcriptional regulator